MSKFAAVHIYRLCDPRDGSVRYVGKTAQALKCRLRGHLYDAERTNSRRVCKWISDLVAQGLRPVMELIEVAGENWPEREVFWIEHYASEGADLTNVAEGGFKTRGWNHSPETKAAMTEERKRRWQNPDMREKIVRGMKIAAADPEIKAKRSASVKAALNTDQYRENASQIHRKKWQDPAFKERQVAVLREAASKPDAIERQRAGQLRATRDPAVNAKRSATLQKHWSDPAKKAASLAAMQAGHRTPEAKAKHKLMLQSRWANPEYKARVRKAISEGHKRRAQTAGVAK